MTDQEQKLTEDAIWQNIYNLCNQQNGESAFRVFKAYVEKQKRDAQPTPAPDVQAEARRVADTLMNDCTDMGAHWDTGGRTRAVKLIAASLQSMLERGKRHISNISTFGEPITDAELRHVELLIMEPLLNDEDPKKGTRLLCGLVERLRVAEKELAKHRPSQDGGNR